MNSYPRSDEVLADLGDKIVEELARAHALARADLAEYRNLHPDWVAQSSQRGLANWIHDRIWYHLAQRLDGIPSVAFRESGATREIFVGTKYRLRAKRHGEDGRVRSYPTQTALDFMLQEPIQTTLPGLEEVRLIAGYDWEPDAYAMGKTVLSLRDGVENIIWLIELPEVQIGGSTVSWPVAPTPSVPSIDIDDEADEAGRKGGGSA